LHKFFKADSHEIVREESGSAVARKGPAEAAFEGLAVGHWRVKKAQRRGGVERWEESLGKKKRGIRTHYRCRVRGSYLEKDPNESYERLIL